MAKDSGKMIVIGLSQKEVTFLSIDKDKIVTDRRISNTTTDWSLGIKQFLVKYKATHRTPVKVILGNGVYTTAQLPQNDILTEEEMRGIAMYKDLDDSVAGAIADYTWDFYDQKTSKNARPLTTFVLIPKRIIASIAEAVNEIAKLESITTVDFAMTDFLSYYQSVVCKRMPAENPANYVKQLCIALYMPADHDLTIYGVYAGEFCYSRTLKQYRTLNSGLLTNNQDPIMQKLVTEIYRLSDDFFTSQLSLPPLTKLFVMVDSEQLKLICDILAQSFPRLVEVIPLSKNKQKLEPNTFNNFAVTTDKEITAVADQDLMFLPLLGCIKEGVLTSEED